MYVILHECTHKYICLLKPENGVRFPRVRISDNVSRLMLWEQNFCLLRGKSGSLPAVWSLQL